MKRTLLLIAIALIGLSYNVSANYVAGRCPYIYQIVKSKEKKCADVKFKRVATNASGLHCDKTFGDYKWIALNKDLGETTTLAAVEALSWQSRCESYNWNLFFHCDGKDKWITNMYHHYDYNRPEWTGGIQSGYEKLPY